MVLAECDSPVLPVRGEALQLDMLDAQGGAAGPSTLWRVVSVTIHVPSMLSAQPSDTAPHRVRTVEVYVLPDNGLADLLGRHEAKAMTESAI